MTERFLKKIIAQNQDDLRVISALCSGAKIKQSEVKYLKENKHLIVALLFIDFDLYKPCKVALKNFLPRMANGSILAFDEINNSGWPGETSALIEELSDLRKVKIEKFHFDSNISYIIL